MPTCRQRSNFIKINVNSNKVIDLHQFIHLILKAIYNNMDAHADDGELTIHLVLIKIMYIVNPHQSSSLLSSNSGVGKTFQTINY